MHHHNWYNFMNVFKVWRFLATVLIAKLLSYKSGWKMSRFTYLSASWINCYHLVVYSRGNIHTVMIKNVDTTSHDISWHHNWYNLMNVSISLEVLGNCFDCKVVVLQEWVENVQIHRFISFLNQLLPFGCLQQGEHSHSHDKECWHYISDISWHYNWYNLILI